MVKKMMLLGSALAALVAFAAPAIAQADELTESGTKLAIGAEVTATSTNLVTKVPGLPTLECKLVTIHGDVTENGPSIQIEETETTVSGCNLPITEPAAGSISLGGGAGLATGATFIAAGSCHFAGNIPFSYATNTSVLNITGEKQLAGPCGEGTMTGSFTLETKNGAAVVIK